MLRSSITVFIEYRIDPQKQSVFFKNLPALREATKSAGNVIDHEIMEGIDQPGLIVEVIQVGDMNTYEQLKAMRQSGNGIMGDVAKTIHGGSSRVNVWAFQPVEGMSKN